MGTDGETRGLHAELKTMQAMKLEDLAAMTEGRTAGGRDDILCHGVSTDSRTLHAGDLFIALRGDRFDGHDFAEMAFDRGASAILVDDKYDTINIQDKGGVIIVGDTLEALQRLAHAYRLRVAMKVIGITGSNGKTSTKDMLVHILETRYKTHGTRGNLNNHIGLPLSILGVDADTEYGVFEMGMNHPGEIAQLSNIADPDCAIVTNIGTAHIEFMKTREAIAHEKASLPASLDRNGVAILPANDDFLPLLKKKTQARIVTAGIGQGDVFASHIEQSEKGSRFAVTSGTDTATCNFPVHGRHMVSNALLAIAAGIEAGLPLDDCCRALGGVTITDGRLQLREIHGIHFLDDTYNANPESVAAALEALQSLRRTRCGAVLGPMGELGSFADEGHDLVGRECANASLDFLIVVGRAAEKIAEGARGGGLTEIHMVPDTTTAATTLEELVDDDDTVLVKGSRSARMEDVMKNFESKGRAG